MAFRGRVLSTINHHGPFAAPKKYIKSPLHLPFTLHNFLPFKSLCKGYSFNICCVVWWTKDPDVSALWSSGTTKRCPQVELWPGVLLPLNAEQRFRNRCLWGIIITALRLTRGVYKVFSSPLLLTQSSGLPSSLATAITNAYLLPGEGLIINNRG